MHGDRKEREIYIERERDWIRGSFFVQAASFITKQNYIYIYKASELTVREPVGGRLQKQPQSPQSQVHLAKPTAVNVLINNQLCPKSSVIGSSVGGVSCLAANRSILRSRMLS